MEAQTKRNWTFTVDVDGVYTCDTYDGHSHPFPDEDLIACARFCSPTGKIEDIIQGLDRWEFFTEDKELQKEIELEPMSSFADKAFYKEHIFPQQFWKPIKKQAPYGYHRNVYGAIHVWKAPERKN